MVFSLFETATKTSGSRFVFLKGQLALLERAISNFMLDVHTKEFGYSEISPPLIVSDQTMFGTGQLPKFEKDQFEVKLDEDSSRKFLIPTAEVILTNIVREKFLTVKESGSGLYIILDPFQILPLLFSQKV